MCDINHPDLLEPLRKIHAIEWYCNIKKNVSKSNDIFKYRFLNQYIDVSVLCISICFDTKY